MHHGNRIGVTDIGDEHADQPSAPAFQAAGHLVGAVTEFINRLLDAPGNGIGEQRAVFADEARDAGLGYTSAFGNIKHGHAAALGGGEVVQWVRPYF